MFRVLVYILVFLTGALAGSAFPSYSAQYQQRLYGQLDQVERDLAPFQAIADELHAGSMEALVAHHLRSRDPTFYAEGEALRKMVFSRDQLAQAAAERLVAAASARLLTRLEPGAPRA